MYMTKDDVLKFLPHRDPFLFIDTVESVRTPDEERDFLDKKEIFYGKNRILDKKNILGCTAIAHYQVKDEMTVLAGHFPGNPIVPGVVQVEMMAQASCFTISRLFADPFSIKLEVALLKIENAKFRKPVRPGMNVTMKAICRKLWNQNMSYDCFIYHGEEVIAEASLLAMASF